MSYNDTTQRVLDIIDEMAESLDTLSTTIDNNSKTICEEKINEGVVEAWEKAKDQLDTVILEATEGEDAWLLDLNDNGIDGEGGEEE